MAYGSAEPALVAAEVDVSAWLAVESAAVDVFRRSRARHWFAWTRRLRPTLGLRLGLRLPSLGLRLVGRFLRVLTHAVQAIAKGKALGRFSLS